MSQSAGKNDEYESISGCDGLLLSAGDPASTDEPIRKSIAFQVSKCASVVLEVQTSQTIADMASGLRVPINTLSAAQGPRNYFDVGIERRVQCQ